MGELSSADLKIEIIDPDGPGGQKVYPRPLLIRVTHLPTGMQAAVMSTRSQYKAREIAISMIEWGLAQ